MLRKFKLSYENISEGARFREQYRFAFSIAVITIAYVVPSGNALQTFLKVTLSFSAFFAALFLIASAARVKYSEPGRLYQVFYVSERFRMRMFDWSLDVFAAAFLFFIGQLVTGLIDMIAGVQLGEVWTWIMFIAVVMILGVVVLLLTDRVSLTKSKSKLPKI